MSLDAFVSTAMLLGGLLLMMKFGCGAHMRHAHSHKASNVGRPEDAGAHPTDKEQRK